MSHPFKITAPSEEELAARHNAAAEDRRRRSAQNLFNPINLGHWIGLCVEAGVPFVPAEEIARAPLLDVLQFETPTPALKAFWNDFKAGMKERGENWMARWSCCSCAEVKSRLGHGHHEWHPDLVEFFGIDDFRAYDILYDYPEETIAAYARPWAAAKSFASYPREYRIFVEGDEEVGVSNYYPQRPLLNDGEAIRDVAECVKAAEALIAKQSKRLNCPPLERHWDISKNDWTADLLKTSDGQILFLEGGPPFTPNGGAHPCCFMGRSPSGLALSATTEGLEMKGLAADNGSPLHHRRRRPPPRPRRSVYGGLEAGCRYAPLRRGRTGIPGTKSRVGRYPGNVRADSRHA